MWDTSIELTITSVLFPSLCKSVWLTEWPTIVWKGVEGWSNFDIILPTVPLALNQHYALEEYWLAAPTSLVKWQCALLTQHERWHCREILRKFSKRENHHTQVVKEMKSKARYMRSKSCKEILGSSYDKYVSMYIWLMSELGCFCTVLI